MKNMIFSKNIEINAEPHSALPEWENENKYNSFPRIGIEPTIYTRIQRWAQGTQC